MEWNEETIQRLRSLWQEGLSTAEIGRRMAITKNAVVGKAHRLVLSARPSPIRKVAHLGDDGAPKSVRSAEPLPLGGTPGCVTELAPRSTLRPAGVDQRTSEGGSQGGANVTPLRTGRPASADTATPASRSTASPPGTSSDAARHETSGLSPSRAASEPLQRRRSQSCCWPLGDPGTKQFRFCGSEPIPGKPYCVEHAQLAYVKLRDRRDTVA